MNGEKILSPQTVAKNLFYEFDVNNDGFVSFGEYQTMMEEFVEENTPEARKKIIDDFNMLDTDGNHRITLDGETIILLF